MNHSLKYRCSALSILNTFGKPPSCSRTSISRISSSAAAKSISYALPLRVKPSASISLSSNSKEPSVNKDCSTFRKNCGICSVSISSRNCGFTPNDFTLSRTSHGRLSIIGSLSVCWIASVYAFSTSAAASSMVSAFGAVSGVCACSLRRSNSAPINFPSSPEKSSSAVSSSETPCGSGSVICSAGCSGICGFADSPIR